VIAVILALLGVCYGLDGAPAAKPAVSELPMNPWVEPARDVLVQSCGSCHRPGLPTTNPRALAIFNLHEPVWYATMTDEQLRELQRRIENSSKIEEADRKAVIAFVNCKLNGVCEESHPKESP